MSSIIIGSSNTNGSGSAANLTPDNGQLITLEPSEYNNDYYWEYYYSDDLVYADLYGTQRGETLYVENLAEWNAEGVKEISIESGTDYDTYNYLDDIIIDGFVDVNIRLDDHTDIGADHLYVDIDSAKRATIDTSELVFHHEDGTVSDMNNYISISVTSNSASWSNLFSIKTGAGEDTVDLYERSSDSGSQWTEFDIDLGDGTDHFYFDISAAASSRQTRNVDGGEGTDYLYLYRNMEDVDFTNFEVVAAYYPTRNYDITLDESLLANNHGADEGLIVANLDVRFSDDYDDLQVSELTEQQALYITNTMEDFYLSRVDVEDFQAVTLTYGDDTYTMFTNETELAWFN